jgi:hypothetical protein
VPAFVAQYGTQMQVLSLSVGACVTAESIGLAALALVRFDTHRKLAPAAALFKFQKRKLNGRWIRSSDLTNKTSSERL